jgi:hypothetical protein
MESRDDLGCLELALDDAEPPHRKRVDRDKKNSSERDLSTQLPSALSSLPRSTQEKRGVAVATVSASSREALNLTYRWRSLPWPGTARRARLSPERSDLVALSPGARQLAEGDFLRAVGVLLVLILHSDYWPSQRGGADKAFFERDGHRRSSQPSSSPKVVRPPPHASSVRSS